MKLQQGQLWKTSPDAHGHDGRPLYLRIVELERLSVAVQVDGTYRTNEAGEEARGARASEAKAIQISGWARYSRTQASHPAGWSSK